MAHGVFGTAINCMDGRVQEPVLRWFKANYAPDYVDVITEPGVDRLLAEGDAESLAGIRRKVDISVQAHGSRLLAVVGHHDCAGNPVSEAEHRAQIRRAVAVLRGWDLGVKVVGLWVGADWQVEEVPADDGG